MHRGFTLNWVVSNDGRASLFGARDLATLRELGAATVRFELRLGAVPDWTDDLLARYGEIADGLAGAGIAPIGLIAPDAVPGSRQDDWNTASAEAAGGSGDNPFCRRFAAAAQRLAAALPQIAIWEIWNEPNAWHRQSGNSFGGGSFIYPSNYAALLARASGAIKAVRPRATIITGGLLGHNNRGDLSAQNSGATYLDSVYQMLERAGPGALPFDAIGYHLYVDQPGHAGASHLRQYLEYLQAVVRRHEGGADRLVYITEAGWSTTAVSPDVQAANLETLFAVCAADPCIAAVCWFQVRDNPPANLYFGLCAPDWSHKPAFAAFQRAPTALA